MQRALLLSVLLTVAFAASAQSALLETRVSCRLEAHTLAGALAVLSRTNDLPISFSDDYLPADRQYSYVFEEVELTTVLGILLRDTGLSYTVAGRYLIVRPREAEEPARPAPVFTISGFVEDSLSGERLVGANIYLPGLGRGTITNLDGFFTITVPADSVRLDVSYVGYHAGLYRLGVFRDTRLPVRLSRAGLLSVVEVRAPAPGTGKAEVLPKEPGRARLPAPVLERMPGMLGENDALHALGWLPGVQTGTGNLGGLSVRNGGNGHNLLLLDGAQVYNPNHMLGMFSVFNGSAVKDIELIKGAMPARYGGRLSSVVSVNGREGDYNQWGGEASLGLIVSKGLIEGPIIPGKMSLLVSARRSWWDWLAQPIVRSVDPDLRLGYHFGDLNAKVKHKVSERDDWSLTLFLGQDRFKFEDTQDSLDIIFSPEGPSTAPNQRTDRIGFLWSNKTASLTWNRVWDERLFSSSSLAFSEYRFRFDLSSERRDYQDPPLLFESFEALYFSGVRDFSLRSDFDLNLAPRLGLSFGGSLIWHRFFPQASGEGFFNITFDADFGQPVVGGRRVDYDPLRLDAFESGAYAELQVDWDRLRWQLGLHVAGFSQDRFYWSPQPRLQVNYDLGRDHELIAAFRWNEQYAHLITNNAISLPTDLWAPSTRRVRPQQSWQASLGWQKYWGEDVSFRLEGYYHNLRRLTTFGAGNAFFALENWEGRMVQGSGENYGAEVSLRKMGGRLQGILSYDLSWAWRTFPGLNLDRRFPFRENRRHQFSLLLQYRLSSGVRFAAGWQMNSGNYLTIPTRQVWTAYPEGVSGRYSLLTFDNSNQVNNYRAPLYHRLDVSFDFYKQRKWFLRKWSLGLYNAYNRRNPSIIYLETFSDQPAQVRGVSIFTLIPSVSYQLQFGA